MIDLTKKIIPTQKLTRIANSQKGLFVFKTDARNQFHAYELLNFSREPKLIVPLKRTSRVTEKLLDQHGFNIQGASYIDILSKHIMNGVHQRMKNKSHCMERDTYRQESHKNASHGKYSDNI